MTDVKARSPRDPNPWYRGSKRFGDLGRHAPPGDELENTRDHERIWEELGNVRAKNVDMSGAPYHIKVVRDDTILTTGDSKFIWSVPIELNGLNIVSVETYVTTPSSAGKPTVQIRNRRTGLDVLSTRAEIEVGDEDSIDALTRSVINTANAAVQTNDKLAIDVDIAGTGAKGLGVMVMFDSDPGGSGATGPPSTIPGPPGADGVDGVGVPSGGATGMVLTKNSATDYDTYWGAGGGGGSGASKAITQAAHGLAVGDLVKYSGSAYVKAQADSAANAEVVGIVSAVAGANDFTLLSVGYVSGLSGLAAGSVYFLSPSTAGLLTATEPTTAGQVSKPVLVAVSTTTGYFFNWRGLIISAAGGGATAPSFAKVSDRKASGVAGGVFNGAGVWVKRTLNTEDSDVDGILTLASDQITLLPGTYEARIRCPAYRSERHAARLYNVTDGVLVLGGSSAYAGNGGDYAVTDSWITGRFTVAAGKLLEVQHSCQINTGNGFGFGMSGGISAVETYAEAEFRKVG